MSEISKDWELIIYEYKKSESLKRNLLNNLTWFLDKDDWEEFVEYLKKNTYLDPSKADIITFMGVEFKQYQLNK